MRFFKFSVFICLLCFYFSCKKDSTSISFTPSFYFLNAGTAGFDQNLLLFSSSDTVSFNIIISSTYLLSNAVTVTVGVDDAARQTYNSATGTDYEAMPSSAYSFPATVTATTTSVYDTIPVKIFKHALDISKDYMLPINIVNGGGIDINADASLIYLHTTGSKLSGVYNAQGTKIMYVGDAADSNVNATDSFLLTKNLVPFDSSRSLLDYADLGSNGWKYNLFFFTDIPGGPLQFTVAPNDVITSSVQSGSFKVLGSSYDSTSKSIHIKTSYKNTSGNERIVEESLNLQ